MPGRILVVEDEAYVRKSLTELLSVGGYAVTTANSGKEALKKLGKEGFDVVLSDIKMPGIDGIELLEKIKKKHDIDVIMITGYADLENAIASLKLGAYDFIRKPYDNVEILNSINRSLEKQRLQQELKKSEQKYRALTENANDAIFISSPEDGRLIEVNRKAEELTGYSRAELLKMRSFEIYPEEERERSREYHQKILSAGSGIIGDARVLRKDGTTVSADISASVISYDGKKVVHSICRDITRRKKLEEQLREHSEHLEEMVEEKTREIRRLKEFNENIVRKMEEGIVIVDGEGRVTFANPRMEELLGFTEEELVGAQWSGIIASGYQKRVEEETRKSSRGAKGRYEAALVSKTREEIPVLISTTPLFEKDAFNGVLSVISDISRRKHAEEEMMQRVMKYRVERGNAYLVKEKELERGLDVLLDLVKCGYTGLIITRTPPEEKVDVPVVRLSENRYDEATIPPIFSVMEEAVENHAGVDRAVLLDGLDYLISKNGFAHTMEFVQRLNEIFFIAKGILIIAIDPSILNPREMRLLEKECAEVKLKHESDFPEDLYEILEYVHEQNKTGKKPAHKDVEERFKITRTTARKRINRLKHLGLMEDRKYGKCKVLKLAEKGKAYF